MRHGASSTSDLRRFPGLSSRGLSSRGLSPRGSRPVGSRPVGSRPVGSRPVGSRPVGSRPVGSRPMGSHVRSLTRLGTWAQKIRMKNEGLLPRGLESLLQRRSLSTAATFQFCDFVG